MNAKVWVVNEWKSILKNPKMLIPLLGIMFVPILYSGTYLWAFWDPYAHTERLPVAVVNEDIPVDYKGKTYSIGDDLVHELKKDESFNWEFVSNSQAEKGIRNNHYFFRILIPKDFSKRATTLTEQNPTPLMLYYESSLGSNYVASRIGETGIEKLREKLSRTLSENYAKTMFENIVSIGKGLEDAGDSTHQLSNGLAKVLDGSNKIRMGMEEKKDSIQKLSMGAKQISSAASQLADGSTKIHSKMSDIQNGMLALNKGLNTINASSNQLNQSVTTLSSGAKQLNDVMTNYTETHPELNNDPSFQQMVAMTQQLNGGLNKFGSAFGMLNSGILQSSKSIKSLSDGTKIISMKMQDMSSGAKQLASSQKSLSVGTTAMSNGWNQVENSLGTIVDGEKKLLDGSQRLENGLKNGADDIKAIHSGQPIYEMMSNPVRLKENVANGVPNYGVGMAPFFLSISLYVGALLLSTVFPLRDTHEKPPTAFAWFISKFVILVLISFGHSMITNYLLVHLVGIKPLQMGYFYLYSFFSSMVFMSIIQFLVTSANNVGRFIGIILLVLQLTASSGTFPVELIPTSLQRVHDLLPMTYTVEGFATIISTGDYQVLFNDVLALLPFFVLSILLTMIIMKFLLKKKFKEELT